MSSQRKPRHSKTSSIGSFPNDFVCETDRLPSIKFLPINQTSRLSQLSVDSTESFEYSKTPKASSTKPSTFHTLAANSQESLAKSHCISLQKSLLPMQPNSRSMITLPSLSHLTATKKALTSTTLARNRFIPGFRRTDEQTKEENEFRCSQVRSDLQELSSMPVITEETRELYNNAYVMKDAEKAIKLSEPILSTMGLQLRSFAMNVRDSGMTIYPATGKFKLAYFYKLFIPELCRFNFTFLSKLRLNTISICETVELTDKKYAAALDVKLHNGLFVLEKMVDQKSVQQHWFKVVLYHFLKQVPEFYGEWQDLMMETGRKSGKVRPFEDMLNTFNYMLGIDKENYEKSKGIKVREQFLKEALEKFDLFNKEEEEKEGDE